jgi:hypothetical protein
MDAVGVDDRMDGVSVEVALDLGVQPVKMAGSTACSRLPAAAARRADQIRAARDGAFRSSLRHSGSMHHFTQLGDLPVQSRHTGSRSTADRRKLRDGLPSRHVHACSVLFPVGF